MARRQAFPGETDHRRDLAGAGGIDSGPSLAELVIGRDGQSGVKQGARAPRHFVVSCLLGVDGPLGASIIIDPAIFTLDAAIP